MRGLQRDLEVARHSPDFRSAIDAPIAEGEPVPREAYGVVGADGRLRFTRNTQMHGVIRMDRVFNGHPEEMKEHLKLITDAIRGR